MKITKEQIDQIINEEIDTALAESDWDPTRMTKNEKDRMRRAQGQKKPRGYKNTLPSWEVLQAKMIVSVLDNNPDKTDVPVSQSTHEFISQNRGDLLGRVFVK